MRPAILNPFFATASSLEGIGPKMLETLARVLGTDVNSTKIRDLLFHIPNQVLDRRYSPKIFEAEEGKICTFTVSVETVQAPSNSRYFHGNKPYKIICSNETGTLTIVLFNARPEYIKQQFFIGRKIVVSGRVEKYEHMLQMPHPDIVADAQEFKNILNIEPVYPLTEGLTQKKLSKFIKTALLKIPKLPEWVSHETISALGLIDFNTSLIEVHNPKEIDDISPLAKARTRLAFDEMLNLQLLYANARINTKAKKGHVIAKSAKLVEKIIASLEYKLTNGQTSIYEEISNDISSGRRMARLLQGDVGSGKTIIALLAMLQTAESGFQAALMVPTELVATQHFHNITKLLSLLQIEPVLLTGRVKGKERSLVKERIESGEAKIIIGTHAIFQEHVAFKNLALIIVDEQHRFGVEQRMALSAKGENPHILHLSATPIPRSMAMVLYGDMDISQLHEKPKNRKPITTSITPAARKGELLQRLKNAMENGEKVYWVCPYIEEGELSISEFSAVEGRFREFSQIFGKQKTGFIHGRMLPDERDLAMEAFANGEKTLLVATTVIEVGVDVKDASIIVIEQAERFGLSQLHQLRGRVGRGEKKSYCVLLMSESAGEEAKLRLKVLTETEDGFTIADADLRARGGGELIGRRQTGMPNFRFFDFQHHAAIISHTKSEAERLLKPENQAAADILKALFA